ncbi:uncharacterized protein HD556DRAFT_1438093 [Suillus plorans]|uniref:Uncharacterized protein n=1 Tax=Suillus plorans TaxID=116603 RepID=A0A9P7J4C6_9AGAM|nr:uncharacterized protein HD556DRAFT_1438093 [Suillus plorans]KAG1802050.1 hypothetical protein HD556DRAFT_1438093 [Suillus plorans]
MPLESLPSFFTGVSDSSWSHFDLNIASGVAIFFGGQAAVSVFALRPLYGRIWHGWYNAPGCHAIVWALVRTLLQGSSSSYSERLALSLGLDGKEGPQYIASRSGTVMPHTRHLAYVLNKSNWEGKECKPVPVGQRNSPTPMQLIIVDFKKKVLTENDTLPPRSSRHSSLSMIASATSIAACAICASVEDWLSFKMILLGIISSGITSFIMSIGHITLERLKPAHGAPRGDGMLLSDSRIVILRGNEEDVNAVTKGKLRLELKGGGYTVLLCAFIALLQVTLQVVFMPFGSLPGQLMFLLSLLVSGVCNLYLSTNEDDVKSSALIALLNTPEVKTYQAHSRAAAATLASLALCWESSTPPRQVLRAIIPIRQRAWKAWSEFIVENIREKRTHYVWGENKSTKRLDEEESKLLHALIDDAHAAHDQYIKDHNIT